MSSIEIIDYSEKAIAIKGDTRAFKDVLVKLNGKWNNNLRHGDSKFSGWILSKKHRDSVNELLNFRITKVYEQKQEPVRKTTCDVSCQTDFVEIKEIKKKKKIVIIDDDDEPVVEIKKPVVIKPIEIKPIEIRPKQADFKPVVQEFLVQKCPDIKQLMRISQQIPGY